MLWIQNENSIIGYSIVGILVLCVVCLVVLLLGRIIIAVLDGLEMVYALFSKRPIFVHFYPSKKVLSATQIAILDQEFTFYKRLGTKRKQYFRHRVAVFLEQTSFEGKEDLVVTEQMKVLVAATTIMLTFGFRNYILQYVQHIIIYPNIYYSRFSKTDNKGEFNARLKTIVFSWHHFIEGYRIEDDKLNLGIHEFAHAIHLNSIKNHDINSILFVDTL